MLRGNGVTASAVVEMKNNSSSSSSTKFFKNFPNFNSEEEKESRMKTVNQTRSCSTEMPQWNDYTAWCLVTSSVGNRYLAEHSDEK